MSNINNEAKTRRLTRLVVLGKAKVISYKDLKEVRAKRSKKDKAIASKGKGKYGYKRKSAALEAEVEAGSSIPKIKVTRISEVELAEAIGLP